MRKRYGSKLEVKRGKYGCSKVKGFAVLGSHGSGLWMPARQLCVYTGIGYYSLARTLPRWVRFGYVIRRPILFGGDYEYHLEAKGRAWLRLAVQYLPNYLLFMDDLRKWQSRLTDEGISDLLRLGFVPFTSKLEDMIHDTENS